MQKTQDTALSQRLRLRVEAPSDLMLNDGS